jgi:transcriptional regulator with XRE-family HTH domain
MFDIPDDIGYYSGHQRTGEADAMGVEGREKQKILEAGALALSGQLGATVQRLRKAYNLSLSELSAQSGVAKSIISQIERNETNPTLATIWRLAQALDVSIERVLQSARDEPFLEKTTRADTPILVSDDGKCRLAIIGWIKTVDWLQAYEFSADPGGVLESEAHQRGSVESLSVREGELVVEVGGVPESVKAGETLRYRCDRPHVIRNLGKTPAQATMVCILKAAVME